MTINEINLKKYDKKLKKLAKKLNCITLTDEPDPKGSIMHYGQLCKHDDGYLCEHRLKWVLDYLKNDCLKRPGGGKHKWATSLNGEYKYCRYCSEPKNK